MLASLILYPTWLSVGDKAWQLTTAVLIGLIRMLDAGDLAVDDSHFEKSEHWRPAFGIASYGEVGLDPVGNLSHASQPAPALAGGRSEPEVTAQI
jgi:hypothetical protein